MISVVFLSSILLCAQAPEKSVPQMKEWEADVRKRIAKDDKLKALAAKYPLVVLHSRQYAGGAYLQSAFSFIYETTDANKHLNDVQFLWGNGTLSKNEFEVQSLSGQHNLLADLGKVDFEKNPEIGRIRIDDPGLGGRSGTAFEGHVYLERVRDSRGNNFYVLFQIVAVDPEWRYVAFLWRRLPGGKLVKQFGDPPMKEWEQDVRQRMDKDDKLRTLAAKYPLVLLHARWYARNQSAFSFIYETSDQEKITNDVQIQWGNGGNQNVFGANMGVGQQNLVADLGKVDFEKNPEIGTVRIDDPSLGPDGIAVDGHVYLERVRDTRGNDFYVLFQIVAVDPEGRYMAFIWRRLPGGKIVKSLEIK